MKLSQPTHQVKQLLAGLLQRSMNQLIPTPITGIMNYMKQPITVEQLLAEVDRIASAGVIELDELTH